MARTLATVAGSVDPSQIVVELTETLLIDDPLVIGRRLDRLRSTGVSVSVDDFGAGFTSVAHLRQFPISQVKIDRALITELEGSSSDSRSVAGAVVALAQALQLDVIAEGVETFYQLRALVELGCRIGQGYIFSAPVSAGRIGDWLAADVAFADVVSGSCDAR